MSIGLTVSADLIEQLSEVMPATTAHILFYLNAKTAQRGQNSIAMSQQRLAVSAGVTRDQARRALEKLAALGFIKLDSPNGAVTIHVYNIHKIILAVNNSPKDAPRLPQDCPEVAPTLPKESSTKKSDIIINNTPEVDHRLRFDEIWGRYPRKFGRKEAQKHFAASVKTSIQWECINASLDNFLAEIRRAQTEPRFIPHGSTWFNNWQDWVHHNPHGATTPPSAAPHAQPYKAEPPPERDMTPEEMRAIREEAMAPRAAAEETVPASDVNALVLKLAGGARRIQ